MNISVKLILFLFVSVSIGNCIIDEYRSDLSTVKAVLGDKPLSDVQDFIHYMQKYNKNYSSDEELRKHFNIYSDNVQHIAQKNKEFPHLKFGINQFADIDRFEFAGKYKGYTSYLKKQKQEFLPKELAMSIKLNKESQPNLNSTLPPFFDWRINGAVSPVKQQGPCESCWAFSVVGNIESQYFLKHNVSLNLSAQQLVDCDGNDRRCWGGHITTAFDYIKENGGIMTDNDYPYNISFNMHCFYNESKFKVKVNGYEQIKQDENEIAAALISKGPLSIAINSDHLQFYEGGVIEPTDCKTDPDHAVLLVGYGVDAKGSYWIVKNSYGAQWGVEGGYFHLRRGTNTCGMVADVSVSIVE